MEEEDALLSAVRARPEDLSIRLTYVDLLEERGHPGAQYLRAEVDLFRAAPDKAAGIRRSMLALASQLPAAWRDRFEQPDLLLAPPAPFKLGWFPAGSAGPTPYRAIPNIDPEGLSPDLPWLSGDGIRERLDQADHEREEREALAEIRKRASELGLILPPGFEAFVLDFPRRGAVARADWSHEVCFHDAALVDFPRVGEGCLVNFFGDMNYGDPNQRSWSLYLAAGAAWHCVVAFELGEDLDHLFPEDPQAITYCAPSFQAFLYRWCREGRARRSR